MFLTYLVGDVARRRTLDRGRDRSTSVDRVERGSPDHDQATCVNLKRYNG